MLVTSVTHLNFGKKVIMIMISILKTQAKTKRFVWTKCYKKRSVCKSFSFCTVKNFCMTKLIFVIPSIIIFIFEKQILNFCACVVIQVSKLCFQNLRQKFTFSITFRKKTPFLELLLFSKNFQAQYFFS